MTSPIDLVLPKLEKVRQRTSGQWSACCPAHDDKGPSLSVRETPEGAVLLYCFGGCNFFDVVTAIGLEPEDLFPPRERSGREPAKLAKPVTSSQALEVLDHDVVQILIVAREVEQGLATPEDLDQLSQAASRVKAVYRLYQGGSYA